MKKDTPILIGHLQGVNPIGERRKVSESLPKLIAAFIDD
jgi:hypothetical protein